jgi:hypothetical protein
LRERVSLVWIDWRLGGRSIAWQSLGRFVLLCLLSFAFLVLHLSGGASRFLSSQYVITAVLRESVSPEDAEGLARKIAGLPAVRSAAYRDPAAAWKEFLLAFPGVESLPNAGGNPLPGYIEVRIRHDRFTASGVGSVISALRPVSSVDRVLAGEDSLSRVLQVDRYSAVLAWGVFALFLSLYFVICRLQDRMRSSDLAGDIGFLLERGISERRLAASRAAGAAISGFLLAAAAVCAAAAGLHILIRRYPLVEKVVGATDDLTASSTAAAAAAFILCVALLAAASNLFGWMAARPSRM